MDPAQQPSTPDLREFPRKVRDVTKREERGTDKVQVDDLAASHHPIDNERLRYRELFDFAPDAYLVTDMKGVIREANVAAGRMLSVEPRLLAGKPLPNFFDQQGRKEYRHQLDRICDFDRLDDWEITLQPRQGEPIAVSISIARASKKDANGGYWWILRDITRRMEAEAALRELNRDLEQRVASRTAQLAAANRMKDELLVSERISREEAEAANRVKADFLALLSHEFRTPLQAIFGYTELLERQIHGPLNELQLRDLRRIRQSQDHLLGLITAILDFARLDNGQEMDLHLCPTGVHEILREMEGFIGSQLEKRALQYKYCCRDETVAAQADPAKVQQIVLNLLANALKFTPPQGSITLDCTLEGSSVAIRVTDTGIGIPSDKLETVFQPFVQIRSMDAVGEGSGLGLSISRKLATAMGGTLTAASTLGKGSTFTLRLPVARA